MASQQQAAGFLDTQPLCGDMMPRWRRSQSRLNDVYASQISRIRVQCSTILEKAVPSSPRSIAASTSR